MPSESSLAKKLVLLLFHLFIYPYGDNCTCAYDITCTYPDIGYELGPYRRHHRGSGAILLVALVFKRRQSAK